MLKPRKGRESLHISREYGKDGKRQLSQGTQPPSGVHWGNDDANHHYHHEHLLYVVFCAKHFTYIFVFSLQLSEVVMSTFPSYR